MDQLLLTGRLPAHNTHAGHEECADGWQAHSGPDHAEDLVVVRFGEVEGGWVDALQKQALLCRDDLRHRRYKQPAAASAEVRHNAVCPNCFRLRDASSQVDDHVLAKQISGQ